MKSSEESFSTVDTDRVLCSKEIDKDIKKIQNLLIDTPEFFKKLVRECMKVGKTIEEKSYFFSDVETLLASEIQEIIGDNEVTELLRASFDLAEQLCYYASDRLQTESMIEEVFLMGSEE